MPFPSWGESQEGRDALAQAVAQLEEAARLSESTRTSPTGFAIRSARSSSASPSAWTTGAS